MDSQTAGLENLAIDAELSQLFATVENNFKTTKLGKDRWYILTISCLVAGQDPEAASQLYLYLINQSEYITSTARQALIRRLREALVKAVSLVGICKPLEAVYAISKVEREVDKDYTCTRSNWQCDQANHDRGREFYGKIYGQNADDTKGLFAAHKDFDFVAEEITYGFYLGDRQTLDDLETEMVVLATIMSQNLKLETHWHIRGTRRIGVSREDTQVLWDAIKMIAEHFGTKLNKVPSVNDVEPHV